MSLVYNFSCGADSYRYAIERRLAVKVNGQDPIVSLFDAGAKDLGEFTFTEGDDVLLTVVDITDVGEVSKPIVVEFVASNECKSKSVDNFYVSLINS